MHLNPTDFQIANLARSWLLNEILLAEAVKKDLLKYREALAMEYSMGHISFEELQTAVGREAEDVRMISEMTQKGKKEIDRLFGE